MKNLFNFTAPYPPRGDQPRAMDELTRSLKEGNRFQTLLGVTGSGKTYTMAGVIANMGKPALIISHNKTLAAQLCSEFRSFFPNNPVEYFVSYYDYYQPEAYIPRSDTFIEKDASINQEIDRLRHSATQAVLEHRDVIVVASVSCIYGLGSPQDYRQTILVLREGKTMDREQILDQLVAMHFYRNNYDPQRGQFRLRGEVLEICPAQEENLIRVEFFGDEVETLRIINPITGEVIQEPGRVVVYPAKHFVTPQDKLKRAINNIQDELQQQIRHFQDQGKILEAQRIEMRTNYDLELLEQIGYCNGVENYSRHLTGRRPGEPPYTLIDYFPGDFITFIDESHATIPQLHGMQHGDRSRKKNLVDFGFRLPSAFDNRPLSFDEFLDKTRQIVFVSATPGPFEMENSPVVVEQIIRPTGLVDPMVIIRPVEGQVDDLIREIKTRATAGERVLVTTLTKKMAENLTEYLSSLNMRVRYLHSEIDTLDRIKILRDLRLGEFDCLVGINLLREGLDLPEVSLVAILDADKEGFLRSETSLVQTIGRAARNLSGTVILYADRITGSIKRAVDETNRRREIQLDHNRRHNITPRTIRKAVTDILASLSLTETSHTIKTPTSQDLNIPALQKMASEVEKAMKTAAGNMEFETAAALRDEMFEIQKLIKTRLQDQPVALIREETMKNLGL